MANLTDGTNYYEILEVAPDAPQTEIHRAYQRAKTTYSTDNPALYSMFSQEEARELLKLIEEAYATLSNQSLRKAYDENMTRNGGVKSGAGAQAQVRMAPPPTPHQIASEHQALPDFETPESPPSGGYAVRSNSNTAKSALPPGMGKTTLSTFKIDEEMEREIGEITEFDGQVLAKIRNYKNVTLDRMSEATRVSRTYLTAVEANDYKALPAAVFVRGFVVQMARLLGMDENKVASSYIKIFKAGGGK
jgi:curved DNA-binding protein CbpA